MRILYTLTFLCLLATSLFSQIEKGAFQVGGNLNIQHQDGLTANSREFHRTRISTRGAIFLNDKVSTGISLSYTYVDQGNGFNDHSFGYGIFGRWHKPVLDKFYFYIQLSAGLSSGRVNNDTDDTFSRSNGYSFSARPGLIYFLGKRIGLELTAGSLFFRHVNNPQPFNQKSNVYGIDLGLSGLSLGGSIYF